MKKVFAVFAVIALLLSAAYAEEYMNEVDFPCEENEILTGTGAFAVVFTGEYSDHALIDGRMMKIPVRLSNFSDRVEFGMIIDAIIVNGWDTRVAIPLIPPISMGGKKKYTINVYYTEAGIKSMEEIETIVFKAHIFDRDYNDYPMNATKITFNWGNK